MSENSLFRHLSPEWTLVFVATLWGCSFIMLSTCVKYCSPALMMALRFGSGALLTACLMGQRAFAVSKEDWIGGFWAGLTIFIAYFLQVYGIQSIPSSISGFLTALYVPFVPILQYLMFRKAPGLIVGTGIAVAFLGMTLILDPRNLSFTGSFGEIITIVSAVFCAFEIIVIGFFARKCTPAGFCLTQLIVVAVLSALYTATVEEIRFELNTPLVVCLSILAVMVAVNQYLISWAQKFVSPPKTALIYTMEPVVAGIVGVVFAGEKIGVLGITGGILVIASVLISSWLPKHLQKMKAES